MMRYGGKGAGENKGDGKVLGNDIQGSCSGSDPV